MDPRQIILFLIGLFLLLIFLMVGKRRRSVPWIIIFPIGLGLVFFSFLMPRLRIYQCKFTTPEKIEVYGHVKGDSKSYLNGYSVLLYEGNVEIANNITHKGSFARNKKDKEADGYFEFEIPNTGQLTRCSLAVDFKQTTTRRNYLWHDFNSLGPGANFRITLDGQAKIYTLAVLQKSAGEYPNEINIYHTYLDPTGTPAINIPIKTYTMYGDSAAEMESGYYVEAHPQSSANPGTMSPIMMEVRDAWVEDDSANPITPKIDPGAVGEEIIDIDNCTGSAPIDKTETRTRVYLHEVQFQGSPSYDLGQVAIKAIPSLGFVQGKIDTANATISMHVPAWTHMKYKIVWHNLWKPGKMRIDSGSSNNSIPMRAKIGLWWELIPFSVDCP